MNTSDRVTMIKTIVAFIVVTLMVAVATKYIVPIWYQFMVAIK